MATQTYKERMAEIQKNAAERSASMERKFKIGAYVLSGVTLVALGVGAVVLGVPVLAGATIAGAGALGTYFLIKTSRIWRDNKDFHKGEQINWINSRNGP